MTKSDNYEALRTAILANRDAGASYKENRVRRKLATEFEEARVARGMTMRQLAQKMGTSLSQAQRLLHYESGGSLTLKTVVRAADVLGLTVTVNARRVPATPGAVVSLGSTAWCQAGAPTLVARGATSKPKVVVGGRVEWRTGEAFPPDGNSA